MKTKYTEMPISVIKRDPDQPRKRFDEDELKGIAQSLLRDGMINAIEVDDKNVIVTGERRYRAAQIAGLETIPVKILTGLKKEDRFRRQVVENIHTNTLGEWEKAVAFGKLVGLKPGDKIEEKHSEKMNELANMIGKKRMYIREHLEMLEMPNELRNELSENRLHRTITRVMKAVPARFRDAIQKKIIKEKLPREGAQFLVTKLRLFPNMSVELLKPDYSGMKTFEMKKKLDKIAPNKFEVLEKLEDKNKELDQMIKEVFDWMRVNSPESMPRAYKKLIGVNLTFLSAGIKRWSTGGTIGDNNMIEAPKDIKQIK